MLALAVSALLGLYLFLPDFLFDRIAYSFVRLKKHQRTAVEEIFAGVIAAGIPFACAWLLTHWSWTIGHHPFFVDESAVSKYDDYKTVISSLISDKYFDGHEAAFWQALDHVKSHQLRFLFWEYLFLFGEIAAVIWLTMKYGRWKNNRFYRYTVGATLLRRASEWYVLLTPFAFPRKEGWFVVVDVMTTDGHLYQGVIEDHFINKEGELSGILLKNFKRFRYAMLEDDRKKGVANKNLDSYWRGIPGTNFFIASDKIVTLNIRYNLEEKNLILVLKEAISRIMEKTKFSVSVSPEHTGEQQSPGVNKDPSSSA